MSFSNESDVICALATAVGQSAIGVVRMSGKNSSQILRKIAPFLPQNLESHRIYYGNLRENSSDQIIDEVLISFFGEGRSYTGEESFEISCHGNPTIIGEVLARLVHHGARLSRPGEFTFRAFINGRIDLTEAEAVHAVIASESKAGVRIALRQLNGGLSEELNSIAHELYGVLAQVEAGIDFSTEGLELWTPPEMARKVLSVLNRIQVLIGSYNSGKQIREGIAIAIVGEPNVGKSSLLNALVEDDRAIVADLPGTTRDVVKESIEIDGVKIVFLDTAGLRETSDQIEKMGIEKSQRSLKSADWVFGVYDRSRPESKLSLQSFIKDTDPSRWVWIGNKSDLMGSPNLNDSNDELSVSCRNPQELRSAIFTYIQKNILPRRNVEGPLVSIARHFNSLKIAQESLVQSYETLSKGLGAELAAVDLQRAVSEIDEILGKRVDEGVIDRIFKDFCLGK